jgi:hypothetical protein
MAAEIAIPDVNRSWSLPPAKDNALEITLPFLMTYAEHRSVGGYLFEYLDGHQDITHGTFSSADIEFSFVCEKPPGMVSDRQGCPGDACPQLACLDLKSQVWLAPFDFGITQKIGLQFKSAPEEPGLLEIHVRLLRESGEANAWLRINKKFLLEIRKQLLLWRSLDEKSKIYYEKLLEKAERRWAAETE